MGLVADWLAEAERTIRGASSMALATVDPDGRPAVRMVISRGFDAEAGWVVFYSDRGSRKGQALDKSPRAAVVLYWEPLQRQIRIEGPVTVVPDADADRYWNTRPRDARIAAIATDQSRPIPSRETLLARVAEADARYGPEPPRPARWIGYRVWAEQVELWVSQPARIHDRAVWTRALTRAGGGFVGGPWSACRLEP